MTRVARPTPNPPNPASVEAPASLKANAIANYLSQICVALAGFATMPFFLRRLGAEAYGLIGFFTLMNAWFQILDAGLSLTLARECARYRAGAIDAPTLRGLVRALEVFFFAVASLAAIAIAASSQFVAADWLNLQRMPVRVAAQAVLLMGLTVPLQWVTGLYRGAIVGFERQVWLSIFNAAIAVLRFGGAGLLVGLAHAGIGAFFVWQFAVSLLELVVLVVYAWSVLPQVAAPLRRRLSLAEVRTVLKFSSALATAVVAWVLSTQIDKVILSKVLRLADYGIYTLAVVAAGGVTLLQGPVSQALMPRMVKLSAEHRPREMISLYRDATQAVAVVSLSIAAAMSFFPREVIFAWTGDGHVAAQAAPILAPYAFGGGIVMVGAFPYYLQYAAGDLRLHVIGTILIALALVPTMAWAASRYGGVGAGWTWSGIQAIFFLAWTPLVHRRLMPGLHWSWIGRDVLPVAAVATLLAWGLSRFLVLPADRLVDAFGLAVVTCLLLLVSGAISPATRRLSLQTAERALAILGGRPT